MIRKDRECIIPDISRTYHFGSKGLNINPYFQELYFQKHSLMTKPNVKLKDLHRLVKIADSISHIFYVRCNCLLDFFTVHIWGVW